MSTPRVDSISVYPIKSFGPSLVSAARIVEGGGLEHDREFGIFDANDKFVNGKRNPKVHHLTAAIDWKDAAVYFKPLDPDSEPACFDMRTEIAALEAWLSSFFDEPVTWRRNSRGGFPDDSAAPGPTIISGSSYAEIATWYNGISVPEIRKRFRANIEIACEQPFWEDHLFTEPGEVMRFKIGDIEMHGTNPCKRCVVPTRETIGGETYPDFAKIFMTKRAETLPAWSTRSRFDHFYRLCINTRVPESEVGKQVMVGDTIQILGVASVP
jgi:uncharacterized protein YcbX